MARYIGGFLLAALVLWTGEARGACAWVLWIESQRVGEGAPPSGYTSWSIDQSFEQRAECVNRLENIRNEREALLKRSLVRMNDAHLIEPQGTGYWHIVYRCLPDTIDPRGPKGR